MASPEREQLIRTAWAERASGLWSRDVHRLGVDLRLTAVKGDKTDILSFNHEYIRVGDKIIDQIVCEGVVVAILD